MPVATALAHPNLALVKYWGQRDVALQLPMNDSISVNLSGASTLTSVTWDDALESDQLEINGAPATPQTALRVSRHLDHIRTLAGTKVRARVLSQNSFPSGIGIASSASGFAALTLAAAHAAGLRLDSRTLSSMARMGSGSACRSIPDGFAEWSTSPDGDSYAHQLVPQDHWELSIITVHFSPQPKAISSLEGHRAAPSSPFFETRLQHLSLTLETVRRSILERDFRTLGMTAEREALSLHSVAMSSQVPDHPHLSGIYYWQPETLALIHAVQKWRAEGLEIYFTLDAGPAIHLLSEMSSRTPLLDALNDVLPLLDGKLILSTPGKGARLIADSE